MNKTLKTKKLLFPLIVASVGGVCVGCSNSDYDFNEIDMTLGLGGNELVIPTSSTKVIAIDDILKLEEGESVRIDSITGDYIFVQEGDTIEANPLVEKVTFAYGEELFNQPLNLYEFIQGGARNSARAGETDVTIEVSTPTKVLEYKYDAEQEEILSITKAGVSATMQLTVTFSPELAQSVSKLDELTWVLPDYMVTKDGTNEVKLTDVESGVPARVTIDYFDFSGNGEDLTIEDGAITLKVAVNLKLKTTVAADKLLNSHGWSLQTQLEFEEITLNSVAGKFNPSINFDDIGDVEVSDAPDFLKEDGVYIDLANPQVIFKIYNEMDVPAFFKATLDAIDGGVTRTTVEIPGIEIYKESTTNVCICRDEMLVSEEYADYDKYENADIVNLISTIPDKISFKAETEADHNAEASFELGIPYTITASYKVEAPIAFGRDASIVYTDSIDDIHSNLDGFELSEGACLEVTADVENKLPIYLDTKVTPLDVNGNNISEKVAIDVESDIPAADKGTLKITIKGDIQELDKLMFKISGTASDGKGNSLTGVTLNKNDHSLKLDNVSAKIVGKVIYDAK